MNIDSSGVATIPARPDENGLINVPLVSNPEGLQCWLNMPEMGVEGEFVVTAIEQCPEKPSSDADPFTELFAMGQVTGRFMHSLGRILELRFEGEKDPLGSTASHPFGSYDRDGWIAAGELRIGERVQCLNGPAKLESMHLQPNREWVYTIEVEEDHVYRVGEQGLLVHNTSFPSPMYRGKADSVVVPGRGEVRFIDKGKPTERVNNTRGASLNMDLCKLLAQFSAAREVLNIPATLKNEHVPTRDNPLHYEVMPKEPVLTFDQFVAECAKISLGPVLS